MLGSNDGWKARILRRLDERIRRYKKELSDPARIQIQDFELFVRLDEAKKIRTAIRRMKPAVKPRAKRDISIQRLRGKIQKDVRRG